MKWVFLNVADVGLFSYTTDEDATEPCKTVTCVRELTLHVLVKIV